MKKRPTVILTRRWPQSVEDLLAQRYDLEPNLTDTAFTAEQMQSALERADAVCPTVTDTFTEAMFAKPLQAKILANFGAGHNHIPLSTALAQGLTVSNTPDVLTDCTADLTLMLLLMTARRASEGERELRKGDWSGWRPTHLMGTSVSGKTLGILGMGRIGRAVAQRAQLGFGMHIVYHNRSEIPADQLGELQAQYFQDLDSMLPHCDFLSLHCPATADTAGLISLKRLQLLPKGAFLVNTARGDVLDELALVQALQQGSIAGAGLDVYQGEPDVNPGLKRDDVVLLPHLGSATLETRTAMGMRVAENLRAFFDEQPVPDALKAV
jgi:lactate dehydrogenase-like 2-hydroxyacid dehydrogenase